jgi:hypothetical protein
MVETYICIYLLFCLGSVSSDWLVIPAAGNDNNVETLRVYNTERSKRLNLNKSYTYIFIDFVVDVNNHNLTGLSDLSDGLYIHLLYYLLINM